MFKKAILASALCAALSFNALAADEGAAAATVSSMPIGVINVPLILNDIPQARETREALEKEFAPRAAELQKMDAEGKELSDKMPTLKGQEAVDAKRHLDQLQSEFNLKGRALQEDQNKRVQEEQVKLFRLVQQAVDTIAKERGLQLVLRGEGVVFATQAVDISSEVIARVSKLSTTKEIKAAAK